MLKALARKLAPQPRSGCRDNYPFDFDGGLRYARPKTGYDYFPYPPLIGMVSGFMALQDNFVYAQAYGKKASGPGSVSVPVNLQWQVTLPGLAKTSVAGG